MIEIKVNDKTYPFSKNSSVLEVLNHLALNRKGIAVALNQEVIPKQGWKTTTINDKDSILVIQATQGG